MLVCYAINIFVGPKGGSRRGGGGGGGAGHQI